MNVMVDEGSEECVCGNGQNGNSCVVKASFAGCTVCCLVDTGAKVSIISEQVWARIKGNNEELELDNAGKTLVGIGNEKVPILGIANLKLSMLQVPFSEVIPFAVVQTSLMPYCSIIGANFISANGLLVDFSRNLLCFQSECGEEVQYEIIEYKGQDEHLVEFLGSVVASSEPECSDDLQVRYVFQSEIPHIQSNDFALKSLMEYIDKGLKTKHWKNKVVSQFKRYAKELCVRNGVLMRVKEGVRRSALPFLMMAEMVVKTHQQLG